MFTGLVESTGRIAGVDDRGRSRRLRVETPLSGGLRPGDSIAVDGVCLTVTASRDDSFDAEVSPETLRVTSLSAASSGRVVNLERPLRADGRLGGHFVLGHVDGVGRILEIRPDAEAHWLEIEFPDALAPLLVPKGSIAVDGISLTVASLSARRFGVQIVPFTWEHTSLPHRHRGDEVNLETDMLGKYVVRLLETRGGTLT